MKKTIFAAMILMASLAPTNAWAAPRGPVATLVCAFFGVTAQRPQTQVQTTFRQVVTVFLGCPLVPV